MTHRLVILAIIALQIVCAVIFMLQTFSALTGFDPIPWALREVVELGAVLGLIVGAFLGSLALRQSLRRSRRMEQQLRAASGAFLELMQERFEDWGLTPAEKDVALFAIKGMSTAEIAALRETSEGTVKAQTNAIYRKAGVSGRPQLLSLFIDDLMSGSIGPGAPSAAAQAQPEVPSESA